VTTLDFKLTFDATDLDLLVGIPAVIESLEAGLQMWQGTWVFDSREGIPWQADVGKSPELVRSHVQEACRATPGISGVKSITLVRDRVLRTLTIRPAVEIDDEIFTLEIERPY
jgi:hypothetical protein